MMNYFKRNFIILFILIGCTVFAQTNTEQKVVIDDVVAVVGKNIIKYSDLETSYLQEKSSNANTNVSRCDILESMLINKLLLHQAQVDSVDVSDAEVENELNNRINYMLQYYGSQQKMEKYMGKTTTDIKNSFRDIIKENLLIQQEQYKITGEVTVTPTEVSEFFKSIPEDSLTMIPEQYVLSQIVIYPQVDEQDRQEVKDRLTSLRERILKGSKFSTMAQLYSDDEVSAKKGGELGFFSRGTMVSEFENMAFSLQPGEISPVFETKYGYHIIQMIERRGDRVNCRHILLQPKVSAQQLYRAKEKLDSIKNIIDAGDISFEDALIKYSEDEGKINGGLIINPNTASGVLLSDAINATISNVDFVDFSSMKEGEYTKPVEFKTQTSSAYRLIKIKRKIDAHTVNITDDFDRIQSLALNNKRNEVIKSWAKGKIKKTYIKINERYSNCVFKLNW